MYAKYAEMNNSVARGRLRAHTLFASARRVCTCVHSPSVEFVWVRNDLKQPFVCGAEQSKPRRHPATRPVRAVPCASARRSLRFLSDDRSPGTLPERTQFTDARTRRSAERSQHAHWCTRNCRAGRSQCINARAWRCTAGRSHTSAGRFGAERIQRVDAAERAVRTHSEPHEAH